MKTFIFSALALGVMAGCSNTEIEDVVDSGEPVAITLNAGVETAVVVGTRAAIGTDELFKATVLGWEGDNVADYKVAPTWSRPFLWGKAAGSAGRSGRPRGSDNPSLPDFWSAGR